ncbi:hypothetical protein CW304_04065 [Bacillus sp. UFRGS-B20]|nr:hypothetical protein CW304_04065 [Bacillus sp. UFRGS-B20]
MLLLCTIGAPTWLMLGICSKGYGWYFLIVVNLDTISIERERNLTKVKKKRLLFLDGIDDASHG